MRVERFEHAGRLLGLRIVEGPDEPGFHLATANEGPLQVGRNRRPAGHRAPAHYHPPPETPFASPRQEVLHVLTGRIRVGLFTFDGQPGATFEAGPGETVIFFAGHAVDFLEETELLEIKQGPYPGPERDKVWLERR